MARRPWPDARQYFLPGFPGLFSSGEEVLEAARFDCRAAIVAPSPAPRPLSCGLRQPHPPSRQPRRRLRFSLRAGRERRLNCPAHRLDRIASHLSSVQKISRKKRNGSAVPNRRRPALVVAGRQRTHNRSAKASRLPEPEPRRSPAGLPRGHSGDPRPRAQSASPSVGGPPVHGPARRRQRRPTPAKSA